MSKRPEQDSIGKLTLSVNGEVRSVPAGTTIAVLLDIFGLTDGKVAVERNRAIAPRSTFAAQRLNDGDQIEIVRFVGGG